MFHQMHLKRKYFRMSENSEINSWRLINIVRTCNLSESGGNALETSRFWGFGLVSIRLVGKQSIDCTLLVLGSA